MTEQVEPVLDVEVPKNAERFVNEEIDSPKF